MPKQQILLIEDNSKDEERIAEALKGEYLLHVEKSGDATNEYLQKKKPDLVIIDFDLKGEDGLQVFRSLKITCPVIMISNTGSIPLAVSATKQGVADFLRKPVSAKQLIETIAKVLSNRPVKLNWLKGLKYLVGDSLKLSDLMKEIDQAIKQKEDVLLSGEPGVPKERLAELIHLNASKGRRRLVKIDLSIYRQTDREAQFWAGIRKLTEISGEGCGTIFFDHLDSVSEHFQHSLLDFFRQRSSRVDKSITVVFGVVNKQTIWGYQSIEIPPLRQRRDNIPYLAGWQVRESAQHFNKSVNSLSLDVLNFLFSYDFPGNDLELIQLLDQAVQQATSEKLELSSFPLSLTNIYNTTLKKSLREGATLSNSRARFERELYRVLLAKTNDEVATVARFIDLPKTALLDRLENLLD
ncbi:MAG: response regulator [bacterium]